MSEVKRLTIINRISGERFIIFKPTLETTFSASAQFILDLIFSLSLSLSSKTKNFLFSLTCLFKLLIIIFSAKQLSQRIILFFEIERISSK